MGAFRTLDDLDPDGKTVLVRVDFNVPLRDGQVTDATRIARSLPTIEALASRGARVVLISHLGRPQGARVPELSLKALVVPLAGRLPGRRVVFAGDCVGPEAEAALANLGAGEVALLENLRFHPGEEANDGDFAAALAHAGVAEEISYLSTAGGAFLEWLQGKTLPGVAALEEAAAR